MQSMGYVCEEGSGYRRVRRVHQGHVVHVVQNVQVLCKHCSDDRLPLGSQTCAGTLSLTVSALEQAGCISGSFCTIDVALCSGVCSALAMSGTHGLCCAPQEVVAPLW